ncbi:MAG: 16S rRNA (adenine(1518)-N(6)/adenine(1519)-N(6))-dimethyltransferase RsmA [Terriglobales bacterium]
MSRAPRVNARSKRPRLGQNLLVDQRAAERIVEALGDVSRATVVEIGPGRGALTGLLAERAERLIAIELDRILSAQLRMKYAAQRNVEIVEGDVLHVDLAALVGRGRKAHVVGNLPYYITSPILERLFRFHDNIDKIVLLAQREVAERMAARPGSRDYGLLSAVTQLHARVETLFTLPPGAFSPPPKVHSTALQLTPAAQELGVPREELVEFLKLSFAQKRKTLANNLKSRYGEAAVRAALEAAGLRADVRAEAVGVEKAAEVLRSLVVET